VIYLDSSIALGRQRSRRAAGADHRDLRAHQIVRQRRQPIQSTLRPAIFDRDPALGESAFSEAPAKPGNGMFEGAGRSAAEEADHRHRRLLRVRGKR
jgi:hypothetical protein